MSSNRHSRVVTETLEKLTANVCEAEKALADRSFLSKLVSQSEKKSYDAAILELEAKLSGIVGQLFIDSDPIQMLDDFYFLGDEKLSPAALAFTHCSDKLKYLVIHDIKTDHKPGRVFARWVDVLRAANVHKNYMVAMSVLSALISFSDSKLKRMNVSVKSDDKSIIDRLSEVLASPADMINEFKSSNTVPQMSELMGTLTRIKEKINLKLCEKSDGYERLSEIQNRLTSILLAETTRLELVPADKELITLIKSLNVTKLRADHDDTMLASSSQGTIKASSSVPVLQSKLLANQPLLPSVRRAKTSGALTFDTLPESPRKKKKKLGVSQESIESSSSQYSAVSADAQLNSPRRKKKTASSSSSSHISARLTEAHSASSLPSVLDQPLSDVSSPSLSPLKRRRVRKDNVPDQLVRSPKGRVKKKRSKEKLLLDRSASTSSIVEQSIKQTEASISLPILELIVTSIKEPSTPVRTVRAGSVAQRITLFEELARKNVEDKENLCQRQQQTRESKSVARKRSHTLADNDENSLQVLTKHMKRSSSEAVIVKVKR